MKRGSTMSYPSRLAFLLAVAGALLLGTAGCELFYRLFNQPPVAGFSVSPSTAGEASFTVTVNAATSSTDPDDNIESYTWDFGDGADGTGASASHTYTAEGTYTLKLTVTDAYGEASTASKTIYVSPAEVRPTASFTASPTSGTSPLTVSFNATASSYADGTIQTYEWDFGDGKSGYGSTVSHTYVTSGSATHTVTLTVRATDGKTGTATKTVTVSTSGSGTATSGAPSARFDIQTDSLGVAPFQVAFDPSDSEADEGRVLILYTWSFGDGDATSGISPTNQVHVYTTDEPSEVFSVTLLVLDNEGDGDSITKTVKAYNHRPVAGFEIANPPGGDAPAGEGKVQYANAGEIAEADWEADDVVYGDLGEGTAKGTVWIRSKPIDDDGGTAGANRWFNLDGTSPQEDLRTSTTSATTSTTPTAPTGYIDHNFSYDPEGQTWAGGTFPPWFDNQSWGIQHLYIDWGDNQARQRVDYVAATGMVESHEYTFGVDGSPFTIIVTAEDYLGQESAEFSRQVWLKSGTEGTGEL